MDEPTPEVLGALDATPSEPPPAARSATGHGFGEPGGADPAEAGAKGGKAKRAVSITAAIRDHLEANPGDLAEVAAALVGVAKSGKAGTVEAGRVLLDRVDGPISLGLDAFVGQDRVVLLRTGADGAPLPGYEHAPALPEGLEDLGVQSRAEAFDEAREAEVLAETSGPRGEPERAAPRQLPAADLGLGDPPEPEGEREPGWRPSKSEGG